MKGYSRLVGAVAFGAIATPVAALVVCGGAWGRRRSLAGAAVCAAWLASCAALVRLPWPPAAYITALALLNVLASAALERLAPPPAPRRPTAPGTDDLATIGLSAVLFGSFSLFTAAFIAVMVRMARPEVTRLLGPSIFLWAAPGLTLGALLGWARFGRGGPTGGRAVVSTLAAAHAVYLAGSLVFGIAIAALFINGIPLTSLFIARYDGWRLYSSLPCVALGIACCAWAGGAPSVGRVILRSLAVVALWTGFTATWMISSGLHGAWQARLALDDASHASLARRARGIERIRAALRIRPNAPDRAYLFWNHAEESLTLGRDADAERSFRAVAGLPEDALGQELIFRARRILAGRGAGTASYREAAGTLAVEKTDYLDADWRAVLGLWRSAAPQEATTASLNRLRDLSLSEKRIRLPRMDGWSDLAALSAAYGAAVVIAPGTPADVRRAIDAGKPVLIRRRRSFHLVIGYDRAWNAYRFIDYRGEPPWLVSQQARAEAAGSVGEDEKARIERLGVVRRLLAEWMSEADLSRALSDSAGLFAVADAHPRPLSSDLRHWAAGEDALESDDPVLALEHYARAARGDARTWLLPYIHAAALSAERRSPEARALGLGPTIEGLRAWRKSPEHEALLAEARQAVSRTAARDLPSSVLEHLTDDLDVSDPAEHALRDEAFAALADRFPEEPGFLAGLADACRTAGDMRCWLSASLRRRSLVPSEPGATLDAAEAALALGDLGRAADLLAQVNPFDARGRPRLLLLTGRLDLKRGRPRRALDALEDAVAARRMDPDAQRDLARALDAVGRPADALPHWRWLAEIAVDPDEIAEARRRLGGGG